MESESRSASGAVYQHPLVYLIGLEGVAHAHRHHLV
jgi:hypothetical protein